MSFFQLVTSQKTRPGGVAPSGTWKGQLVRENNQSAGKTWVYTYDNAVTVQGDVTAILTTSGTAVVEYTYDAWGNPLTVTGTLSDTLGEINSLRYRGYVYDNETGYYYLQSRYYNPELGRFINADAYAFTGQGLLGNNMFAYCCNNPVTRADSEGTFWHIIGGAALGAVVSVATKMITNAISGENLTDGLLTAAVAGAVSGGLAASGIGLVGQVAGNALIGMANNATDQYIGIKNGTQDGFDPISMLIDGAVGAIAGLAGGSGAGNKGLTKIGLTNVKRSWNALTNKGVKVALEVLGQGLKYFGKNASHMVVPLVNALAKSAGAVIICKSALTILSSD